MSSYTIEPFFFSSSLNWIPSRYQEDVRAEKGDRTLFCVACALPTIHGLSDITITLTFLRTMPALPVLPPSISRSATNIANDTSSARRQSSHVVPDEHYNLDIVPDEFQTTEVIDTQAPLNLRSGMFVYPFIVPPLHYQCHSIKGDDENTLLLDVLDVHMIRDLDTSTMVFYHPEAEWQMTSARDMQDRFSLIGESVYWQDVFRRTKDPTFLLLAVLWHALYAWDEALEVLYSHICYLVSPPHEPPHQCY